MAQGTNTKYVKRVGSRMMKFTAYLVPVLIAGILIYGLVKKVNVFDSFIQGAKEGLHTAVNLLPALVALMVAVTMFKASGALDILTYSLDPLTGNLGIPKEALPLALLRPISGSGSLAMLETILAQYGPDSLIGRVACILQGSTETTFYTIAVYYGAVGIKNTRHTVFAAMAGDFAGLVAASLAVRLFF